MSDVVERLRADARFLRGKEDCAGPRVKLMAEEAADEIERLRAALIDARECVEAWAAYASDYFKEKHDLDGDLARIDAALKETNDDPT